MAVRHLSKDTQELCIAAEVDKVGVMKDNNMHTYMDEYGICIREGM